MTLEDYFRENLTRTDPYPAIDHALRVELRDGRPCFYIHPNGRDGQTLDFFVDGNVLTPRKMI